MIPNHFNRNGLPPVSDAVWFWIKTSEGELHKVKRTSIIADKDHWLWPCITIDGESKIFKVVEWAYS